MTVKDHNVEEYKCSQNEQGYNKACLTLWPAPGAEDFFCIEIELQINCTWGQDVWSYFTLFYMDKYGNRLRLNVYKIEQDSWRSQWGLENVMQQGLECQNDINLVLQSCSDDYVYCVNQTLNIDRASIMKSASPIGLEVVKTDSHSAVLQWIYEERYPVEFIITYQLPGMEWMQELKASPQENCEGRDCKMELKLPCPGELYELKIYVKSTTAPQKPEYWLDPATITFHAVSQDTTDAVDRRCYEESESIVNKYVGEQKVKEFKRSVANEAKALHRKIQSMNRKLDTIKKLKSNL